MSELAGALGSSSSKYNSARQRNLNIEHLFQHMFDISDDPSGSLPEDYMNEVEVAVCRRFLELASDNNWEFSNPISMQKCWVPGRKAWNSSLRTAKAGLTKALFYNDIGDKSQGYVFAKLGISPSQPVALCSDGLLRSMRGPELKSSMALGWGRLPDPDILKTGLSMGMSPIEYGTRSISAVLAEKLPIHTL